MKSFLDGRTKVVDMALRIPLDGLPVYDNIRRPDKPPEWKNPCMDTVSNVVHLPSGYVIYDIRVPRTDWLGRLLMLSRTETRIEIEEA